MSDIRSEEERPEDEESTLDDEGMGDTESDDLDERRDDDA